MQIFFLTVHTAKDNADFILLMLCFFIPFGVWFLRNLARDHRIEKGVWSRTLRDAYATEKQARIIRKQQTFSPHIPGLPLDIQFRLPEMTEIEFEYYIVRSLWAWFGHRAEEYRFRKSPPHVRRMIKQIDNAQPYHTTELSHV